MKTSLLLLLGFLMINLSLAQERQLQLTNEITQSEVILKAGKRIRIHINDGIKISGKFTIIDNSHILIRNNKIAIQDIVLIKKNPLAQSIISHVLFTGGGAVGAVFSVGMAVWLGPTGLILLPPSGVLFYAGISSVNFMKAYKTRDNWNYNLVLTEPTSPSAGDLAK